MGDYLKLFETHSEYETYSGGGEMLKPNVSYCRQENEVHYNPWVESKLVCKYNVTQISSPTQLRTNYESNVFKSMEIDGVQLDNLVTEYTFGSTGVHTVKYELYDETKLGNNAPLFYEISLLISASIPDSVTSIGDNAFLDCGLTSVTIPSSVTSIGGNAFEGCGRLANVTIPNSVTRIGQSAFGSCYSLTSVTIPSSVTSIGGNAFRGCGGLVTITVESSNSTYDSRNNCNAIIETATNTLIAGCNNTVIPNNVTVIGDNAFSSRRSLTSIVIPNSVTRIGNSAFHLCDSLTSVTIPSSVTSIGDRAFYSCTSLTSVTVEATTAPTIQSRTFENVKTNGTLTVPSGSSGYYVWMDTGDYYLGKYKWTKVEQ